MPVRTAPLQCGSHQSRTSIRHDLTVRSFFRRAAKRAVGRPKNHLSASHRCEICFYGNFMPAANELKHFSGRYIGFDIDLFAANPLPAAD